MSIELISRRDANALGAFVHPTMANYDPIYTTDEVTSLYLCM